MPGDKKIACPECDAENAADAKRCAKCDLPFEVGETISLKDMFRIFDARDKSKTKKEPEKKSGFRLFGGE